MTKLTKKGEKLAGLQAIRAATVGAKNSFATKMVNIAGVDIQLRQLSVKQRDEIAVESIKPDKTADIKKMYYLMIIESAEDPQTGEKIFTRADIESFDNSPSGGWLDELKEAYLELNGLMENADIKKS